MPTEQEAAFPLPKTWPQKVRRELGRVMRQVECFAMRPLSLTHSSRYLFILAHMRSGSSLLCHLLCNSEDIVGVGEAHHNYYRRRDLFKLLVSVRHYADSRPHQYRYVLDKIVGVQHVLGPPVLSYRRTRYVFLVREPLATIASLVAMRRQYNDETPQQALAFAAEDYVSRLTQLVQLAKTINDPTRCLMMTHQQMMEETPTTFSAIEGFLRLRAPLSEDYELLPTTGQPGWGDPSPNIRKGRIDRSLPRSNGDLPAQLRFDLEQNYKACVKSIRENSLTISPRTVARDTQAA